MMKQAFHPATQRYASLFCLLASFLPAVSAAAAPTTAPLKTLDEIVASLPKSTVSGKVLDSQNNPLEGADVILYYNRDPLGLRDRIAGQTKTGADGSFRFEKALVWEPSLASEERGFTQRWQVLVRHPQHGLEFAVLLPSDPLDNVTVKMEKPRTVKVTVTDSAGKPVEGAVVHVASGQHTKEASKDLDRQHQYLSVRKDIGWSAATSDASGQLEILACPRGEQFKAIKDGYAVAYGGSKLILYPAATLTGKVTFADGKPAAGVPVVYEFHGDRLVAHEGAITDAAGQYKITHAPAHGYRYSWMKQDQPQEPKSSATLQPIDPRPNTPFTSEKVPVTVNPGDQITKDLVLDKGCVVSGKVLDIVTGQPVPNMRIDAHRRIEGSDSIGTTPLKTDANGVFSAVVPRGANMSFQWDRSREGDYVIDPDWRQRGNHQPARDMQINEDKTDLVFRVKLWKVQTLIGNVLDDKGQPIKNVGVYIHPEVPPVKTDAAGKFTLKTAPVDRDFDLCDSTEDKRLAALVHLKAGATESTITLQPTATYGGQVTCPDGAPADRLKFYMDLELNGQAHYYVRQEPKTDAQGNFTVKGLIPGTKYRIFWSADNEDNRDYNYGQATVDLTTVKPGEPIKFQAMKYDNALMGQVVDPAGNPIANATITEETLRPQNLSPQDQTIRSDKNGHFTIPRLGHGTATVRIAAPGYKAATFKTPSDSVDFKAALRPAAEPSVCTITLVDEQNQPIASAPVKVYQEVFGLRDGTHQSRTHSLQTDANGRCAFKSSGSAKDQNAFLLIWADLPGRDIACASVASNEDADARLVAARPTTYWRGRVIDKDGKPVTGATVRVTSLQTNASDPRSHVSFTRLPDPADDPVKLTVQTDSAGSFEVSRISRSHWVNVMITAPKYAAAHAYFDPRQDGSQEAKEITLAPGAALKGHIAFKSGAPGPAQGQAVVYLQNLSETHSNPIMKIAPDWTFGNDNLMPGKYLVMGHLGHKDLSKYVFPQQEVEIVPGKTTDVVVEIAEGIPLRGKLIDARTKQSLKGWVMARMTGEAKTLKRTTPQPGGKSLALRMDLAPRAGAGVEEDGSWIMYLPCEGQFQISYMVEPERKQQDFKTITVQASAAPEEVLIEVGSSGPAK